MTKITLNDVADTQSITTSAATINANSDVIVSAMDNTISRDGTAPNTMQAPLDMNSQQIINLPAPVTGSSPLRLTDASTLNGGGTIATIPAGGTTGQAIVKASNTNYDLTYGNIVSSVGVTMPAGITVVGSPITSSGTIAGSWTSGTTGSGANVFANSPTLTSPTFAGTITVADLIDSGLTASQSVQTDTNKKLVSLANTGTNNNVLSTSPTLVTPILGTPTSGNLTSCTGLPISTGVSGLAANVATFLATPSSANLISAMTDETGTGANVFATSPTLVTPILGTPTSGTLTSCTGLPITTGVSGLGTNVGTFLATPSSANLISAVTDETGTGALMFGTSPTVTTPNIVGTTAVGNAAAGSVGEYVSSIIASGSAVSLTTATNANVTSISLTAGDWDIWGVVFFTPGATTNITNLLGGWNTASATLLLVPDKSNIIAFQSTGIVPGAVTSSSGAFQGRLNVSSTTTVFLIAQASFTVSTLSAFGGIQARRVR